ncbi:glycosyltransferase [Alkalihalophilus lindianensis]|uniref:Glycosyltransferase n=1 Tax=Alkalihalophilus lindianensis TaxID=1630542 RepID=A0ABU3X8X8_9BACI|nr:glycosyltransferase [Alkalihalophilus lindianensis]MDV2684324.1 glycosyltransferase [Alkalihalophilus lindianensis]
MNKKLRVLVLSNMYPGPRQATFGIFVKNQVEALRSKGVEVDVIAVQDPSMAKPRVLMKYSKWMIQTLLTLITKGRRYDVVHAHYIFPTGVLALLFKKMFKTKLVVTSHGGDIERMAKKNERTRAHTANILNEADEVIAVGEKLYEQISQEYEVPSSKMTILNMGVNREVFKPIDQLEAKQKVGIPADKRAIVFIGNLIKEKGLLELLEAYKELKEKDPTLTLCLIGNEKKLEFKEVLIDYINENNLEDVVMHPAVSQAKAATWMSAADVFVLPSHLEGFGLVALEAMSCGTPVLGSRVGGLEYLLQGEHGSLVEPQNARSLEKGIEDILDQKDLAKRYVEAGFSRADEYDQEKIIEKLIELYQRRGE